MKIQGKTDETKYGTIRDGDIRIFIRFNIASGTTVIAK
jgi:hypothetical protein